MPKIPATDAAALLAKLAEMGVIAAEPAPEEPLADEVLIGMDAIAAFLGLRDRRQGYRLLRAGWPITRLNNTLIARKGRLRAHLERLEAEAAERGR